MINLYVPSGHVQNNDEEIFLSVAASTLALLITFRKIEQKNNQFALEMKRNAQIDYLTGLSNRRHFFEHGELEVLRSLRYNRSLSVLMLDIDHFKKVNDTYGHTAGDIVIQQVAEILRFVVRDVDKVGRIGGEEFSILLTEINREDSLLVAERLRTAIEHAEPRFEKAVIRITASIGIAFPINNEDFNLVKLMDMADKALYNAKHTGRNRVCF